LGYVVERRGRRKAVASLLSRVALQDIARIRQSYSFELSGGEAQRVLIALGLAESPSLLIADEPTTALDETIEAQIMALLQELRSHSSLSLLLITHNIALVASMANRMVVMYAGQVVEEGNCEDIIRNPQHPYTQGLIGCIDSLERRQRPVVSIDGVVPSPYDFNQGCRFASRCARVTSECVESPPVLEAVGANWLVACYHREGESGT
jgi:peptide/nickel transport system permease protein